MHQNLESSLRQDLLTRSQGHPGDQEPTDAGSKRENRPSGSHPGPISPKWFAGIAILVALGLALLTQFETVAAQRKAPQRKGNAKAGKQPAMPQDPKLLAIHGDFVRKAEKLAQEYERDRDWSKARTVYGEILKLAPSYESAQKKMAEMGYRMANANSKVVTIRADEKWQDTGVDLIPGMPVTIRATGKWRFNLSVELGPDGIQIPKELRDFNLGCLVGYVETGVESDSKPFFVGTNHSFVPGTRGRLLLRMYDTEPADNDGALKVEIRGTFR